MKNVAKALLEAKREIGKVAKNAKNPHFKNTYADINALLEAVEPILLDKGLLLIQPIVENAVVTIVLHPESGEQFESRIDLPISANPQQLGSAITYYRRYTLQAEDDDANAASGAKPAAPKTITNENFAKGLDKVNKGEMFIYELEEKLKGYALTKEQKLTIESLKNK